MPSSNVIEILLRAKDQTAPVLSRFRTNLLGLKTAVAGAFAFGGLTALFTKETIEAEKSLALLRNALQNVGAAAGVTEKQLLAQATALQNVTRFSDEAVQQSQALLLRIGLTGEALKRATANSADFAEAMQTDMVSAARLLGRALNDPVQGMTMLRRQGIAFTAEQKDMLQALVESGQKAQAQAMVFDLLEKKFKGAAEAGGNTLGGALAKLKNAFGELFEVGAKDSAKAIEGINKITEALQAPETKAAIDTLAGAFSSLFAGIVKGAAAAVNGIQKLAEGAREYNKLQGQMAMLRDPKQGQEAWNRLHGFSGPSTRGGRRNRATQDTPAPEDTPVGPLLEEFQLFGEAAKGVVKEDVIGNYFSELEVATRTKTQQINAELYELRAALDALVTGGPGGGGTMSREEAQKRFSERFDEIIPAFDIQKIREMRKPLETGLSELSQYSIGVFRRMGESISQAFSDALYEGKFSMQSLKDIVRRTLADIGATIISSGLKNLIAETFGGKASGSSGGGTNWAGAILSGIGSFFGFKAGGGRADGPTIIGNELVVPSDSMHVFNQRQLAFMGAGQQKSLTYAPQYTITIEARDAKEAERRLAEYVETRFAEERAELARDLERNGMGVLK